MKSFFTVLLLSISISCFSQNRICFIDSLNACKDEIARLEAYNWKLIKRDPTLRQYSNLRQFHFFVLKKETASPFQKEEYLDYSFFKKLSLCRYKRKTSPFRKSSLFSDETYIFTPEGKAVGHITHGMLRPTYWLNMINDKEFYPLINKISFAFCGTDRESLFRKDAFSGYNEFYCVIQDSVYILDGFDGAYAFLKFGKLHLTLLEDYINQK